MITLQKSMKGILPTLLKDSKTKAGRRGQQVAAESSRNLAALPWVLISHGDQLKGLSAAEQGRLVPFQDMHRGQQAQLLALGCPLVSSSTSPLCMRSPEGKKGLPQDALLSQHW